MSRDASLYLSKAEETVSSAAEPQAKPQRRAKKQIKPLRRPLSAYNLFYKSECEVLKKVIQDGDAVPEDYTKNVQAALRRLKGQRSKAEFQAIASTVGERWKKLPAEQRTKYQKKAEEEMKAYKKRKLEYRFALLRECETAANDFYRSGSDNERSSVNSIDDASEKSGDSSKAKSVSVVKSAPAEVKAPSVASLPPTMQGDLRALPYAHDSAAAFLRAGVHQPSQVMQFQNDLMATRGAGLPSMPLLAGNTGHARGLQAEMLHRQLLQEELELQLRQKQQQVLESRMALLQNLSAYEQAEKERATRRAVMLRASLGLLH